MGINDDWGLEEIEGSTKVITEMSRIVNDEVQTHKTQVNQLEAVIRELHCQRKNLSSQQLEATIHRLQESSRMVSEKIDDAIVERDRLLRNNLQMTEQIKNAHGKRQASLNKMLSLKKGTGGDVAMNIQSAIVSMSQEMSQMEALTKELLESRQRLETIVK